MASGWRAKPPAQQPPMTSAAPRASPHQRPPRPLAAPKRAERYCDRLRRNGGVASKTKLSLRSGFTRAFQRYLDHVLILSGSHVTRNRPIPGTPDSGSSRRTAGERVAAANASSARRTA
eukprot:2034202-Prymnesium_polylepis.2